MQSFEDYLKAWQEAQDAASAWQARERELRMMLFNGAFPNAKEGTNSLTLPDGRTFKATFNMTRKLLDDEGAYNALMRINVKPYAYLKYSLSVRVGEFKKAPPEVIAALTPYMETSPSLPQCSIET